MSNSCQHKRKPWERQRKFRCAVERNIRLKTVLELFVNVSLNFIQISVVPPLNGEKHIYNLLRCHIGQYPLNLRISTWTIVKLNGTSYKSSKVINDPSKSRTTILLCCINKSKYRMKVANVEGVIIIISQGAQNMPERHTSVKATSNTS